MEDSYTVVSDSCVRKVGIIWERKSNRGEEPWMIER